MNNDAVHPRSQAMLDLKITADKLGYELDWITHTDYDQARDGLRQERLLFWWVKSDRPYWSSSYPPIITLCFTKGQESIKHIIRDTGITPLMKKTVTVKGNERFIEWEWDDDKIINEIKKVEQLIQTQKRGEND